MTTTAPPTLNHAAAALIEALHDVSDMAGLRQGLRNSITYWSAHIAAGNPSHRDAAELVAAWEAPWLGDPWPPLARQPRDLCRLHTRSWTHRP